MDYESRKASFLRSKATMQTTVESSTAISDEFLCVATYLPVRSWLDVVPFLLITRRVLKQLRREQSVMKYVVKADFRSNASGFSPSGAIEKSCISSSEQSLTPQP